MLDDPSIDRPREEERAELRRDPLSGRLVVVAPGRAARPGVPRPDTCEEEEHDCPFCEGREAETPPEVLALAPRGRSPDRPGWHVRVVPNKFPALSGALGRQEVVVHAPRHVRSIAGLSHKELADVASAWRLRARVARETGFPYVQAIVNEGRAAGASREHSHSQLTWLPEEPPAAARERIRMRENGACLLCSLLAREHDCGARIVEERGRLVALCPFASRAPYELLLAPVDCEPDAYASDRLGAALALLGEIVRRLRSAEGETPLNLWLHTSPAGEPAGHWHLEIVPRLTIFAGLELGAELFVNPLAPEEAAARLRLQEDRAIRNP